MELKSAPNMDSVSHSLMQFGADPEINKILFAVS